MATNAEPVVDDNKPVTEDDLRDLKYPKEDVEPPKEADEPPEGEELEDEPIEPAEDDDQIVEPATEDEEPSSTTDFVKQFDNIKGDTPEEYAKNLEIALNNSTTEAMRLKGIVDASLAAPSVTPEAEPATSADDTTPNAPKSPTDLYVQQKLDEEIQTAFARTQKEYPQVSDPTEYTKFTQKVAVFSRTIMETEGRLASPAELYNQAAISLGWEKQVVEPDDKEKLAMAVKNGAAASQTPAAPSKSKPKTPQISEAQLKLNRKMYPGKTDQEIIDELTPYQ